MTCYLSSYFNKIAIGKLFQITKISLILTMAIFSHVSTFANNLDTTLHNHSIVKITSTLVVDDDTGIDDGSSPFATINAAIAAATSGDSITITGGADSTHTEPNISINKELIITGQGQNTTIVQGHVNQNSANNRVFVIASNTGDVVLQDMTIQHGKITGTLDGAGMYINQNNNVTINNVNITKNNTDDRGAGIGTPNTFGSYNITVNINNSTISENTGGGEGGGIYLIGNLIIDNTSFINNTAGSSGGALRILGAHNLTITNSTFTGNSSVNGGAINCAVTNNVNFTNTSFSNNIASSNGGVLIRLESLL